MKSEYTSINLPKARDYRCPKCKAWHNDNPDGYMRNGECYPKILNESEGSTMDGNYHDWDEIHKCLQCGTEFWFRNGSY